MISLKNISRIYRPGGHAIRALDRLDLDVAAGEFVAVMGRSGSGKSTLLNILGCMDRPDEGVYSLDGKEVSTMDDDTLSDVRNRHIGFIFQSFHLLPRKSALDNVMLPRRYHADGIRPRDHERAIALLGRVGLADRAGHKPNELSGGQRQRVAIARALINEPHVLLADEPTGNLDSRTADAIMELLAELHTDGQTIVMVTHEQEMANYAMRRIYMQDGRIAGEEHAGG